MTASDDDEDALLASLEASTENDPSLAHLREARIQQLSAELKAARHQRAAGFGTYATLTSEKALLDVTTGTRACVVHFSRPDFNRCRIMDGHLAALAAAHLATRFLTIDVQHAPFLTEKLGIRVLPCVIAFVEGVGVDRVVGFEGVGGRGDGFETGDLERRLVGAGVLERVRGVGGVGVGGGLDKGREKQDVEGGGGEDDDDDEWD